MNLRSRLSISKGYRELGMYDESILELEEIEGIERWHPLVIETMLQNLPWRQRMGTSNDDGTGVGGRNAEQVWVVQESDGCDDWMWWYRRSFVVT